MVAHQADLFETVWRALDQTFNHASRLMASVHIVTELYNCAPFGWADCCVFLDANEHVLKQV